tara:strand:+ start:775 stop:1377 length:603 start_codon:yes stop_codon:yes gene_type:complete
MNYTELKTNIEDIVEQTFTTDQLDMFIKQAEQEIYNTVRLPALRKSTVGLSLTQDSQFFTLPADYLYIHSFTVISTSEYNLLINKNVDFIGEAYPNPSATGLPKYYGLYNQTQAILGPTPDTAYNVNIQYGYSPESIVTAGTTWLGEHFDAALLNRSLMEAIRFIKGEQDMVALYEKHYMLAIQALMAGSDKLATDSYRI